ncbi:MAG: hypothetical protein ACU85E_05775 [Gammaproteobacteria bacterium]
MKPILRAAPRKTWQAKRVVRRRLLRGIAALAGVAHPIRTDWLNHGFLKNMDVMPNRRFQAIDFIALCWIFLASANAEKSRDGFVRRFHSASLHNLG